MWLSVPAALVVLVLVVFMVSRGPVVGAVHEIVQGVARGHGRGDRC